MRFLDRILLLIGGVLGVTDAERKAYNNGICPDCGMKLNCFDTDSQGGRGYMCPRCNYTTWCTYPVDRE